MNLHPIRHYRRWRNARAPFIEFPPGTYISAPGAIRIHGRVEIRFGKDSHLISPAPTPAPVFDFGWQPPAAAP